MKDQAHFILVEDPIQVWGEDIVSECSVVVHAAEPKFMSDLSAGLGVVFAFSSLRNCQKCVAKIIGEIPSKRSGYLYGIVNGQESKTAGECSE